MTACVFQPARPVLLQVQMQPSHVITAIGVPEKFAYGTVRITLSLAITQRKRLITPVHTLKGKHFENEKKRVKKEKELRAP